MPLLVAFTGPVLDRRGCKTFSALQLNVKVIKLELCNAGSVFVLAFWARIKVNRIKIGLIV